MSSVPGAGRRTLYERSSWLLIALFLVATIGIELIAPVLAWQWVRQPFLGLLVEHTLVASGVYNPEWGTAVPVSASPRLVGVDGRPLSGAADLEQFLREMPAGTRVTLDLAARGGGRRYSVPATVQGFPVSDWISMFWLPYVVGLVYLGFGVWVFRLRGDQRSGQSFAIFCGCTALVMGTFFDLATTHALVRIWAAALPLTAAAVLHLAFVFPEEGPLVRRWPLIRFVPYPIALALAGASELTLYSSANPWSYLPAWHWSYAALGLALLGFFALMIYSRAQTLSPVVRQQVRFTLLGGVLAFGPAAVFLVPAALAIPMPFQNGLYFPTLVIFPVAIAYSTLRYRLLDMDLVVSRGLVYTVLLAVVVGAYFLTLMVLGETLHLDIAGESPLVLAFFMALFVLAANPLRAAAERMVGRLLGWRRIDYRRALQEFSREMAATPLDLPAILNRLAAHIDPVSHAAPALVFLRELRNERYTVHQARGFAPGRTETLHYAPDSGLVRWLSGRDRSLYLQSDEGRQLDEHLSAAERQQIEALDLALFVPLRGQDRLVGWLALGHRLSGEPYSPDDIAFLAALADQTVIAVENAQLLAGARRRAEELMALQQTAVDISARQELAVLLEAITERAARLLGATGGGMYLAEDGDRRLKLVVSYNLNPAYTGVVLQPGEGVAGWVALHGRALRVDDYAQFEGRSAVFKDAAFRAVLSVPLMWQDRVLGVLDIVDTRQTRAFSQEDEWLLSLFASQAAIALRNAQLFADLSQRVKELDALRKIGEAVDLRRDLKDLLGQIYVQTRQVLAVDNFYVALYDDQRQELSFAYYVEEGRPAEPAPRAWPLGEGLTSQVVRQRAAVVTDDYLGECERRGITPAGRPARAWLGVPLLAGDQVLGVLNVSSFLPGHRYTPDQVKLLSAIGDQAAAAIERMKLYEEMKARAAELATLNEVSQTINSTLDLPSVLNLIMTNVFEILDIEAGSLMLLDHETGELVYQVVLGAHGSDVLAGRRQPVGRGIAGHVAQSGRAEIINDVRADPRWNQQMNGETGLTTHRVLCAPLISRDRVVGVIEAINHRDGSPFRENEAHLLVAFAAQAAVAIENARLYTLTDQALARRVDELSTMQRIDRELNAALDFDHVMDLTLDWALRGTRAQEGVIGLYDPAREGILLLVSRGYPPDLRRNRDEPWPVTKGIAGRVVRTGQAALIKDVTLDADYYPVLPGTRSQLTVPIRREGAVIGLVDLESAQPAAFDEEDLAFVESLADHAAIAIENARLYRASQRLAEEMALLYDTSVTVSSHLALDEVLEAVYARIRDVWQPPVFFIALYDEPDDALEFVIYVDRGRRLARFRHLLADHPALPTQIVRKQRPILIRDWEAEAPASPPVVPTDEVLRSWLGVPLIVGDHLVGVMAVQDYLPNVYGDDHRRFLTTIASQVAITIENARLYQETQQRLRELGVLFDTSAALSTTLDVDNVLRTISRQVTAVVQADGCAILEWDREQDVLALLFDYAVDAEGWRLDLPGTCYTLSECPASRHVLAARQPLEVRALDPEADPAEVARLRKAGVQYLLMVPLVVRDEAVGMLELTWRNDPQAGTGEHGLTATDIGLCQTLANQAAVALENSRLYEGVKQANQAKSEFIDFVAHELKQPMTSMQGYARMLTMGIGGEMTPMQQQFVQVITSNVDRMGKLVNDLLEISRLEAGRTKLKLAAVDLREVVEEAVTNTCTEIEARQHSLHVDIAGGLPPVLGDRERLVQVLTNLISNAYKYTPTGGEIWIAVGGWGGPDIPPGYLAVSVRDTGIGMSAQDLAHLEEKFFRGDHALVREQPGTGLGVSITRRLVALHGGEFAVESTVGQGSTFRFTVPIVPTEPR